MDTKNNLGRLQRVELREVWASEAGDFTPWLAHEENIAILADTIRIDLEVEAQEKNVGPFRADILCKDTTSDHWVLIENQLERTDHIHLGQLITYAAGLDAVTIVWIADRFTDEHRAALDWLNEVTADDISFFGLEMELWRIGDSPIAPKFNVVSSPNYWTAHIGGGGRRIGQTTFSETQMRQKEYWTQLWSVLEEQVPHLRGTKALPQNWNNFSIGRSEFGLLASINTQKRFVQLYIACRGPQADAHFYLLAQQRDEIEKEMGETLLWQELPKLKESRITLRRQDTDPTDEADWPNQHRWLAEKLDRFNAVFRPRIRYLNADDFEADVEEVDESSEQK